MWAEIVCNGMMCAAAVLAAAHSPLECRRTAIACALAFYAQWLVYVSAWFPPALAPHMLLGLRSTILWSLSATFAGIYIVEKSGQYWWGKALFVTYVATVTMYVLRSYGLDFAVFSLVNDYVGYVQIAIFVVIGARGCGNRVSDLVSRDRYGVDTL